MKKLSIAALAALMLAGALSAVGDAASISSLPTAVVVGEGSSPFPVMLSPDNTVSDSGPVNTQF
ncbi:MAG: hypothetical protein WA655_18950 [Candidatus Korobacteraceae bacterium]